MNIIQITDCHLFADSGTVMEGVNTEQSLLRVLSAIMENESPDLLLVTGDIAHDEEFPTYRHLKGCLDKLNVKYYCLPGNHDHPRFLEDIFKEDFVGQFQHIVYRGWQLILLSTALPGEVHGRLDDRQLTLLSQVLRKNREPAVIFMHHHPVPVQCPWLDEIGLEEPEEFLAVMDSATSVNAVFFGHVHQEFRYLRDGIVFYGTPSTCFQFKPHSLTVEYDNASPAYRSIRLDDDGLIDTRIVRVKM